MPHHTAIVLAAQRCRGTARRAPTPSRLVCEDHILKILGSKFLHAIALDFSIANIQILYVFRDIAVMQA